jgi:hypothetical protein
VYWSRPIPGLKCDSFVRARRNDHRPSSLRAPAEHPLALVLAGPAKRLPALVQAGLTDRPPALVLSGPGGTTAGPRAVRSGGSTAVLRIGARPVPTGSLERPSSTSWRPTVLELPRASGAGESISGPRAGGPGGSTAGPRAGGPGGLDAGPRAGRPGGSSAGPRAVGPCGSTASPRSSVSAPDPCSQARLRARRPCRHGDAPQCLRPSRGGGATARCTWRTPVPFRAPLRACTLCCPSRVPPHAWACLHGGTAPDRQQPQGRGGGGRASSRQRSRSTCNVAPCRGSTRPARSRPDATRVRWIPDSASRLVHPIILYHDNLD